MGKMVLKSMRIPEDVLVKAQSIADVEGRKRAQVLVRWMVKGMVGETGVDREKSVVSKKTGPKKNREVLRPRASAELRGKQRPSAIGETVPDLPADFGKMEHVEKPAILSALEYFAGPPGDGLGAHFQPAESTEPSRPQFYTERIPIQSTEDVKAAVAKVVGKKSKACKECGSVAGMHQRGCTRAK